MRLKTIHKLVLKSYLGPLIMTFFIITFVLMMNFVWRYIDELVGKGLDAGVIIELISYATINMIPMGLPLAMLLAAIMTMGNLGENYELLAMKSAGMSLMRIMKPLIIVAVFISIGSFFVVNNLVPYAYKQMSMIIYDIRRQKQVLEFQDGLFFDGIDNMSIRVEHQDPQTGLLSGVLIYDNRDANGNMTEKNSVTGTSGEGYFSTVIYAKAAGSIQFTTAGSTTATTINFSAPNDPSAVHNAQLHPEGATAYLPGLTQYANRGDWGSISAGGDNLLDPANKIKGYYGFAANGFSLGSLGGYVQYDFHSNPIRNLDTNPYGVDFVVYGNAFNGNPEAAAVQVYAQEVLTDDGNGNITYGPYKWYELAGSMYYSDSAVRNATVYYTKDDAGLHAAVNGVTHSQDPFTTAATWFPTKGSMNHEATSGINDTTNTYITEYTDTTLKFTGVTSIPDSDSNADYAFGYADVTPVPSVKDGTPVNPYTPYTSDKDGGDGFDLAWAVEIGGTTPVKIDNAKYVRIYSAVLYNTGIFGETSPEITGIFRTNGNDGSTTGAEIVILDNATREIPYETENMGYRSLTAGTYFLGSDAENVYVNETAIDASEGYVLTITAGQTVRIVAQSGKQAPYVTVIVGRN